ncbi:MAG: PH domain-containing protein [Vicinamibacterales bacterium]
MTDARELDPRFIPQQRLVGRLTAVAFTGPSLIVLLIVLAAADDLPTWGRVALGVLWLALIAGLVWHAERWPARVYACTRYALDADGLVIQRGVYWRSVTYVPRSRVQHTDVSQGPLERHYGLGTLVVYTAGTNHARVSLPGLAHEVAMALRDDLRLGGHDDVV